MISRIPKAGGWYGDCTVEGDTVTLYRDSHIEINGNRLNLPPGQSNLLQLVCTVYQNQILVAGQGQSFNNWLWKDGKWHDLGPSFATFSCAFSTGTLYFVCGPNQYRVLDLESMIVGDITPRAIGSNGIRYIDFDQSFDGIVTGDSTYGPAPYNISQWSKNGDVVIGQSYIDGCIALFGKRYLIEPGDTQFIRLHRKDYKIAIAIVKMLEKSTVYYFMDVADILLFPVEGSVVKNPIDKEKGPVNFMPTAKNEIEVVKRMIRLHPEVDTLDENERGKILDYTCEALGGKPWGRKARNKDGSNKNTDALCYLLDNGKFEIYDVISGGDGSATWDYAGTFANGENGYWAEGGLVENGAVVEPKPKPVVNTPKFNKDDLRDGANRIIGFYTSQEGLQRSKAPIDVNDQAAWDWISLFLFLLLDGKTIDGAVEEVLKNIRTFPEWKQKHS